MKSRRKTLCATFVCFLCASAFFMFNYPQPAVSPSDFSVFFGQSLIDAFSAGITFAEPAEVVSAESGRLLIAMSEDDAPFAFPSTLGNTLVLAHEDKMISVYGNMDKIQLNEDDTIYSGQFLGASGGSAWQRKAAGLIFMTCDTKNRNSFNPFMLLPPLEKTATPSLRSLSLVNRKGTAYDLTQVKSVPAGFYMLYRDSPSSDPVPYEVTVLVNGAEAESVYFNLLRQNGRLSELSGTYAFPFSDVYPSGQRQLLGAMVLKKGKTSLAVSVSNSADISRSVTYSIDVQ